MTRNNRLTILGVMLMFAMLVLSACSSETTVQNNDSTQTDTVEVAAAEPADSGLPVMYEFYTDW